MGDLDSSATVEITGKIMVLAIITLFIVVVFILFLHLYAKWFWWRIEETTAPQPPRRRSRRGRHLIFTPPPPPSQGPAARLRRGLDPSVLNFLPAVVFKSQEFKDDLECAVCLSEVVEGEKARLLPNCNHGFHVDCIDMWFHSHSTCPLCRSPVAPPPPPHHSSAAAAATCSHHHHITLDDDLEQVMISTAIPSPPEEISSVSGYPTAESPNFSTNVSVWGVQTQVSTGPGPAAGCCLEQGASSTTQSSSYSSSSSSSASSSLERNREDQNLVIDIPMRTSTDMNSATEEERKTTPTTPARLRSLKRLLSRDKRGPPSSPSASNSSTICVEV